MTYIRNSPTVILQLPNDDPVEDFRFVTKIQKIDTTRNHGIETKDSLILLGGLRLLNEWRLGELLKQMDLKVKAKLIGIAYMEQH
jgi:hypothetical protein